jgi:hypothetical protein
MKRIVQPELLDLLPPADPRAARSRRDLRRVNAWMRGHAITARMLENNWNGSNPRHITELGAGDGNFLLRVAEKIAPRWPDVKVTLLDFQKNITPPTLAAFAKIGWRAEAVVADVFNWPHAESDIVIANLFLHHFEETRLVELFHMVSQRAKLFIAVEPRRARGPLFCSLMLWTIGCNNVTRHDAAVSVRAGFSDQELSSLWPDKTNWLLTEQSAGAFSHVFIAQKMN